MPGSRQTLEELLKYWTPERCREWFSKPENRRAQKKSWVVGELMLEHPEMTRAEAEALAEKVLD